MVQHRNTANPNVPLRYVYVETSSILALYSFLSFFNFFKSYNVIEQRFVASFYSEMLF